MSPSSEVLDALREMAREQPVSLTVRGGCMAPEVGEGERIEVAPARLYWPGDVLVIQAADGRWLIHRLLGWRWWQGGLAAVTRGDGCPWPDPPVPSGRILGRVAGPVTGAARLRAVASFLGLALRGLIRRIGPIHNRRLR
jgi:hypothetical protein